MKTHSQQLSFIPFQFKAQKFFGGALLRGRRKSQRPLRRKDSIHFVLRSLYAKGSTSFLRSHNYCKIDGIIQKAAKKYGVRIYRRSIQSNHIHLIVRIHDRWSYRSFISVISGKIASHVMKEMSFKNFLKFKEHERQEWGEGSMSLNRRLVNSTERLPHRMLKPDKGQAFWEQRPFSRILNWGRDYQSCCSYLLRNTLEAIGFTKYRLRKNPYKKWIKKSTADPRKAR